MNLDAKYMGSSYIVAVTTKEALESLVNRCFHLYYLEHLKHLLI